MKFNDFVWVVFSGKRPEPQRHVQLIKKFVGANNFPLVHWHLAKGDYQNYKAAGAFNCVDVGSSVDAVNKAIAMKKQLKKPLVMMADDIHSVRSLSAAVEEWQDTAGVAVPALDAAKQVLSGMRQVGAKLGGVAPHGSIHYLLQQPVVSMTAFVVGDFWIAEADLQVLWSESAWPKEDYDFTANTLKTYGLVARQNHLFVQCEHHVMGGDGTGAKRHKADINAASTLMKQFPKAFVYGKACTAKKCTGRCKVTLRNGAALSAECGDSLSSALSDVTDILKNTRLTSSEAITLTKQVSTAVASGKVKRRHKWSGNLGVRERKRKSKGTMPTGSLRTAGRRKSMKPLSKTERNKLVIARERLRQEAQKVAKKIKD